MTSALLNASSATILEFGLPEWQAHLGGSFYGPEEHGGILQNWIGRGRCWVVLTGLAPGRDYSLRLEAAPLAPFSAELQEVTLASSDGRVLLQQVLPATAESFTSPLRLPSGAGAGAGEFRWRRLGPPELTVTANNQLLTRLTYETRPDLQIREFLLRADLVEANTVLAFEPNFAVEPDAAAGAEKRTLSFRFFRLTIALLETRSSSGPS